MKYSELVRRKRRKKCPFETYKPKTKINVSKEEAIPFLVRLSNLFSDIGFAFYLFFSGIFLAIESFFSVKKKIRGMKIFRGKYIEIRIKKKT
ncbi:MAG TPA: hypothetical protein VMZ91_09520 [Candidatus Paceibacterota bacterium]|nr:hypothetical protein [Candidatus Paceibacterota bacterium]